MSKILPRKPKGIQVLVLHTILGVTVNIITVTIK